MANAIAAVGSDAAFSQTTDFNLTPTATAPVPADGLQYRPGAFYYGDCGGNSLMQVPSHIKAPPGLILGGTTGVQIGQDMNCDDRRQAMSVYRDGLEGPLGQTHNWHNDNGGGNGSMTPLRQYARGGFYCRDFLEKTLVGMQLVSRSGTACRQADGNWHTL